MAVRFIALALVAALSLGGCATRIDREYIQNKDGVKEVDKSTCVGLLCGGVSSASRGTVLIVPGGQLDHEMWWLPSAADDRYDRGYYGPNRRPLPDRRFQGQWVPLPRKVELGQDLGPLHQYAEVDGVPRVCTKRGGRPDSCTYQDNANNWPRY